MGDLTAQFSLVRGLIQEAKGGAGDEGYVVGHLDAAETHLLDVEMVTTGLLKACTCALGYLSGNMDGDWDLGDPIEMLRDALSKATA